MTSNASRHFKSPLAMGEMPFKIKRASSVPISVVIDTGVNNNAFCTNIINIKTRLRNLLKRVSHSISVYHVPSKLHTKFFHPSCSPITCSGYALDLLVTVSSMCYHTSTSALSTSSSSRGLTNLTLWDILS